MRFLGNVVGLATIAFGIAQYILTQNLAGLLIALAVIVVGPTEDILRYVARQRARSSREATEWESVVDQATSITFLLLLLLTLLLA